MKRFVVDALFVWLIISLMMYITEPKQSTGINDKINEFEDEVARHEYVQQKVKGTRLNDIDENTAARLAQAGSDFVISVMDSGVNVLSRFVQSFSK
ncbi:hypothetical protein D5266_02975 [bacterium c-19]|nr:hypothetical protein [bacterium c-19]